MKRPYWLTLVDRAESYYRHCRIGLTAHPAFVEDEDEELEHFGIPVEMKVIGIYSVPVLPWGWHLPVADA